MISAAVGSAEIARAVSVQAVCPGTLQLFPTDAGKSFVVSSVSTLQRHVVISIRVFGISFDSGKGRSLISIGIDSGVPVTIAGSLLQSSTNEMRTLTILLPKPEPGLHEIYVALLNGDGSKQLNNRMCLRVT